MYNGDNDGDLMSLVRSCSRGKGKAIAPTPPPPTTPDPFAAAITPPPYPMRMDDGLPTIFANLSMNSGDLEEAFMPFFPLPLQQQPCFFLTAPPAGGEAVPTAARTARSSKLQASTRAKKRKSQQKKVVTQIPVDNSTCNDNWAWRKYGQKPIKGSPYPRGYYRCSTSKSCPAKKQVEKSPTDPGMVIVSYTEEHNHPLPTHRCPLAGMTRSKCPASSAQAADGAGTPTGLSPTTPLTTSPSMEEEAEEEEGGMTLEVGDIEVVGDDELVLMGDASALKAPAAMPYSSLFVDAEDPFFKI